MYSIVVEVVGTVVVLEFAVVDVVSCFAGVEKDVDFVVIALGSDFVEGSDYECIYHK